MTSLNRDADRLEMIVDLIDAVERRLDGMDQVRFVADRDESDLTAFRLGHIGENAAKLSADIHARYPDVPWKLMRGLRNIVSHDYGVINPSRIWKTATVDLQRLKQICAAELENLDR